MVLLPKRAKSCRSFLAAVLLVLSSGCHGFALGSGGDFPRTTTAAIHGLEGRQRSQLSLLRSISTLRSGGQITPQQSMTSLKSVSPSSSEKDAQEELKKSVLITSKTTLANYHLLWSPKVWKKMLFTTVSLWITLRTVPWDSIHSYHPSSRNNLLFNAILPTLSSACCWIQMILNSLTAIGCAGFNTYLGPLRPFFLSLLVVLTIVARHETKASTVVLRWTIALLPEMLHLWNSARRRRQTSAKNDQSSDCSGATSVVYLDMPSMGCVACIQKVDESLQRALPKDLSNPPIIRSAESWLLEGGKKGGRAKVNLVNVQSDDGGDGNSGDLDPKVLSSLVEAVKAAGFPCTVDEVVNVESTSTD